MSKEWGQGGGTALAVSVAAHLAVLLAAVVVLSRPQPVVAPVPTIALLPPLPEPLAAVEARPSPADAPVDHQVSQDAAPRPSTAPDTLKILESRSERAERSKPKLVRKRPDSPRPDPIPVQQKADRMAEEESQATALPETGRKDDRANQTAPDASAVRSAPPPSYIGLIRSRLEKQKRYPRSARAAQQEGVVVLRFTLQRDGEVTDWRITQGSGVAELDEEVARMIQKAVPFPAMPEEIRGERLTLSIPIEFSLETAEANAAR